jgi:uncharacterized protein YndB with AHSA1/START domain
VDEVSLRIAAPPEQVYDLVADVTAMGRWSPECTGGRWLDGATGAEVGARFKGTNRHGFMRWSTTSTITRAERGAALEWQVDQSGMRWGYRFERDGDGTVVTEYREQTKDTPRYVKLVQRSGLIGRDRDRLLVDGMRTTLERVREAAEARR